MPSSCGQDREDCGLAEDQHWEQGVEGRVGWGGGGEIEHLLQVPCRPPALPVRQ